MRVKSNQYGHVHLLLIIVAVVALLGVLGFVFWQNFIKTDSASSSNDNATQETRPADETSVQQDSDTTPTLKEESVNGYVKKLYSSTKLGVEFNYLAEAPNNANAAKVTEDGNTIYVYNIGTKAKEGQYVQVFDKDPSVSFSVAIENRFLKNYKHSECFVMLDGAGVPDAKKGYSFGIISALPMPADVSDWYNPNWDKCPPVYTFTNGMSYFMMKNNVPNKLLFVSIGQYGIGDGTPPSKDGTSSGWQSSIVIK